MTISGKARFDLAVAMSGYPQSQEIIDPLDVTIGVPAAGKVYVLDSNLELNSIGIINSVDKIVTSAEVLALSATPITILPAVGVGVFAEFLGADILLDFNSIAYVSGAGEDMVFQNLLGGTEVSHSTDGLTLGPSSDNLIFIGPKGAEAATNTTLVDNGGFEVTIQSGEWSAGDSPLKIRLYFRKIRKAALQAIA